MATTKDASVKANIQLSQSATVPSTGVKNVTVGASGQPGVLTVVGNNDQQTIADNYVTREGIQLDLSDTGTYSESLNNGDWRVLTATLTSNSGGRILAMPSVTLYQGSQASGNEIPDGASVDNQDWEWYQWTDWGASDNNNVVHKVYVTNVSGGTLTLVYRINFRSIIEESSL